MPTLGRLGINTAAGGPGILTLGAPSPYTLPGPPTMATAAKPYIAHLYSTGLAFKALLGPLLNAPMLKWSLNSGFHPITIELPAPNSNIALGDLIYLSEQGGSQNFVYSGKVEGLPRIFGPGTANFQVALTPFVSELGDSGVNLAYTQPTDLAVMIHDAVSQTTHCAIDTQSCPMTGIRAINNFNNTSPLDVLNTCRKIAGKNYWWFVDQYGTVWFQATGSAAYYTFKLGADYNGGKANQSIQDTKNYIYVVGGWPAGASAPITSTYNGVGGTLGERRQLFPNPVYSTVTDQSTLDNIATTLGNALDRVIHTIEIDAPKYANRVVATLPGGPMMRYWEEAANPLVEAGTGVGGLSQAGAYSSTYVGMDNEITLPSQKVIMGDLPIIGINDLGYEIGRVIAQGGSDRSATPSPPNNASTVFGQTGYMAGKDGAGTVRWEIGNLPPRGNSAAHFGVRTNDAAGIPIADSLGLLATLTQLVAINTNNGTSGTNVAGSGSAITLMSGGFTLARTTNVLLFSTVVGYEYETAIGPILNAPNLVLQVDGQTPSTEGAVALILNGGVQIPSSGTMIIAIPALPAGSYTARTTWASLSGANHTLTWYAENLYAYAVGL